MKEFEQISSRNELADFLKIPRSILSYILFVAKPEDLYTVFSIPKKNGKTRQICASREPLKGIQRKVAEVLWAHQKKIWDLKNIEPRLSHAFEKDKSIFTNAKIHRNKRFVLNMDLENFFDSFHFGRIMGFFEKNKNYKLSHEVAVTIAQIACYQGHLPQGAPSSPIISNLICQTLDQRILQLAKKFKLDYTRYADDLTFSTNDHSFLDKRKAFQEEIDSIIKQSGFTINPNKTRLQFRDSKQIVTGLVVNKKINVNYEYYKQTRAMAHRLYTQETFNIDSRDGTIAQLEGRFSFINQIDRYNNKLDGQKHTFRSLNGREKQYQAFLFYKYFFNNDKPLIITEGKTDRMYLISALKNRYKEYPSLIEKDQTGNFQMKISFLNRSKRLRYFFDTSITGADAMQKLYNFFTSENKINCPDFLGYFRKICPNEPKNPVILLYDNEIENHQKPIYKFLASIKDKNSLKETIEDLKQTLFIKLVNDSNLFLMTHNLENNQKEGEIEDLFPPETLAHEIRGKKFSRNDDFDKDQFYGKDHFSQYIASNYEQIDFSGFTILLNTLNTVITQWHNHTE